jgi:negative regulator of flagellin synthesis FlgM
MTIERLGPIDSISRFNKANKANKTEKKENTDSVSFSKEAKNLGEIYKATEEVKIAPDVRMDRVEEVRAKLQDPSYIDEKVLESVAENVLDMFGLT